MKYTMLHQKLEFRATGPVDYIGEDAHPISRDGVLIISDGLGGRGGFPHSKVNKAILEEKGFYDLVFAPIFSDEANADVEFRDTVTGAFSEIFEGKEHYLDGTFKMRCSGYFASRILSSIFLHEVRYTPNFAPDRVIDAFKNYDPSSQLPSPTKVFGDELARIIREKMKDIAKRLNFVIETGIYGAYLLPATLQATLYRENKERGCVEAVNFFAGDSRAYIWDEIDGLRQTVRDHEEGETMTNLVSITEGITPFYIDAAYHEYKTPCVLFNASDGCYKCTRFASPFDFECTLLSILEDARDVESFDQKLKGFFAEFGKHDDSNTLAAVTFGFEDYSAVREAGIRRAHRIMERYVGRLPDIFSVNYERELAQIDRQINETVDGAKELFRDLPISREIAIEMMKNGRYPAYVEAENAFAGERTRAEKAAAAAKTQIKRLVEDNWVTGDGYVRLVLGEECEAMREYRKSVEFAEASRLAGERRAAELGTKKEEYLAAFDAMFGELVEFGASHTFPDMKTVKRFLAEMGSNFEKFAYGVRGVLDIRRPLFASAEPLTPKEVNEKWLGKMQTYIEEFTASLCDGRKNPLDAESDLARAIEEYRAAECDSQKLSADYTRILDECFNKYWDSYYKQIISRIRRQRQDALTPEFLLKVDELVAPLRLKRDAVEKKLAVQKEIYREYEKDYYTYIGVDQN